MDIDFNAMTKAELRAYLIAHPNDQRAFQAFVDRFTAEASSEIFDLPTSSEEVKAVDILIRQKLER